MRTIGTGVFPIAITSDGTRVFVATPQGLVTAIDARNGHRLYTTEVAPDLSGITSDGTHVWVTDAAFGRVAELDPRTGRILETIQVGDGPTGIGSDGADVWVANTGATGPGDTVTEIGVRGVRTVYRYGGT